MPQAGCAGRMALQSMPPHPCMVVALPALEQALSPPTWKVTVQASSVYIDTMRLSRVEQVLVNGLKPQALLSDRALLTEPRAVM